MACFRLKEGTIPPLSKRPTKAIPVGRCFVMTVAPSLNLAAYILHQLHTLEADVSIMLAAWLRLQVSNVSLL
jgi:hypothetical protein